LEEARRELARFYANVRAVWAGEMPATDEAIARWLLHVFPYSREEVWERLRDGMALAGMPVAGLSYHG